MTAGKERNKGWMINYLSPLNWQTLNSKLGVQKNFEDEWMTAGKYRNDMFDAISGKLWCRMWTAHKKGVRRNGWEGRCMCGGGGGGN